MPRTKLLSLLCALVTPLVLVVAAPFEPIATAKPKPSHMPKDRPSNPPAANCDVDGDGHHGIQCGGNDCDDDDARRYPGAAEICDTVDVDEDCNPSTFGTSDQDGDGAVSWRCCNAGNGGAMNCGSDCDDHVRAIVPSAMTCSGNKVWTCGSAGLWEPATCPTGAVCWAQPNGTGVCAPRTRPYVAPATREANQR